MGSVTGSISNHKHIYFCTRSYWHQCCGSGRGNILRTKLLWGGGSLWWKIRGSLSLFKTKVLFVFSSVLILVSDSQFHVIHNFLKTCLTSEVCSFSKHNSIDGSILYFCIIHDVFPLFLQHSLRWESSKPFYSLQRLLGSLSKRWLFT